MSNHVKFGISDYAASKGFFLKALEPLGVAVASEGLPTPWFVADAFGRCANHLMAGGSLRCATVPISVPTTSTKKNELRHFCCNPLILLAEWTEEGPSGQRLPTPHMGLISISDGTGIGFGQRLTHATASSTDGNSQSQ